jgi:hypothetical protein
MVSRLRSLEQKGSINKSRERCKLLPIANASIVLQALLARYLARGERLPDYVLLWLVCRANRHEEYETVPALLVSAQ